MKQSLRQLLLLSLTGSVLLAGWRAVPLMEQTAIGTAVLPESVQPEAVRQETAPAESPQPSAVTAPTQTETAPVTTPELLAPADPPAENPNIINIESEGSKAMHYSQLYQQDNSGAGGTIVDRHFGVQPGNLFFSLDGGGQVRNTTFWSNADLLAESRIEPELDLKTDGTPMVLIYHTHTTESFVSEKTGTYTDGFNFRTTEPDKNMVMVGDAIAEQLAAAGIGVVHAREIHDFPVWSGSYDNSAATVRSILAEYPSICIALDIHRDALGEGDAVAAPVADISGKQSAQIMIISGCDDGTMGMPEYRKNFHFASKLQQTAERMFPGFTRPILFDYRKYNQDLTQGSLLIEVGSQGNTLEEVRFAGELTGKALSAVITELAERGTQ